VSFWHTLNFLGNRNRLVSAFSEARIWNWEQASERLCIFLDLEEMGMMEKWNRERDKDRERGDKTECSILIYYNRLML
jgi:hypothetical protein